MISNRFIFQRYFITRGTRSNTISSHSVRRYHIKKEDIYEKCFTALGISADADQDAAREAYLKLVKLVHPDSGRPEASAERFTEIDNAFRTLQAKFAKERRGIEDEPVVEAQDFDIKHTAPQHRQYLSYEGVGYGPPAQREKQYQASRATKAYERVVEYRIDAAKASENTAVIKKGVPSTGGSYFKKHAVKTKYGFDRVVEDLIQEAMSKGDFDNLQGYGKPLSNSQSQNPYVDFTQHKINKILLDNGFSPEWIMLAKDIREHLAELKKLLRRERSYFGLAPLGAVNEAKWRQRIMNFEQTVYEINQKIDKHNILVPILNNQMFRVKLDDLARGILQEKPANIEENRAVDAMQCQQSNRGRDDDNKKGLFSFFASIF